jgi:hypothetical protein
MSNQIEARTAAVVTVGDGRGFVVDAGQRGLVVVTAAHCLPFFPPCHGASFTEERTYPELLAPLGQEPAVPTECLFADPVVDIAVLGPPDGQAGWDQAAYETLVESATPLMIADAPKKGPGWLLSLEGSWFECTVEHTGGRQLWITSTAKSIEGGMSGSPIISAEGAAIGMVCLSAEDPGGHAIPPHGPNPRLTGDLPGWVLRK